jgi:diguanylate cyclase (GGDEF)-like protein
LFRPFILNLGLVLVLAALCVGIGVIAQSLNSGEQALLIRARTTVQLLLHGRAWSSAYGGTWVPTNLSPSKAPATPSASPNSNPALTPKFTKTTDGQSLRLDTPADFLKEMSTLAGTEATSYRLFSQTPLDPSNLPDAFEHQAMVQFQNGAGEASARETVDNQVWFRYAQPLTVDQSCLACHADQGYVLGEQHGGIGVRIAVSASESQANQQWFLLIISGLAAAALILTIPWLMRRHFVRTVNQMEARLSTMAATDELTSLANRRYFFRRFDEEFARALRYGRSLAIIMLDIDHFKLVNDYYGHQVGDQALQVLASILQNSCRQSDLVARYGGEEFVIMLPEVELKGAQTLAEKLRATVAAAAVQLTPQQLADKPGTAALGPTTTRFEPGVLRFTISLGVACLDAAALKDLAPPTRLVALADAALYQAKHTGRNRVTIHQ